MEDLQDTFIVHTIEEIQVCCRPPRPWRLGLHGPHTALVGRGLRVASPRMF